MGMTISEKILSRAARCSQVTPGEYIWANVDNTNIIGGSIYTRLKKLGIKKLFDPNKVYVVEDHLAPSPTITAANQSVLMRHLVEEYNIKHYYELGRHGIQHELFPYKGYVVPGDFIAGIDSHSISYGCFNAVSCSINEESPYVLLTGKVWLKVPYSIKFELTGKLPGADNFVVGKDVILSILGKYSSDFAIYKAIEFTGPGITSLSIPSRFSIANMSAELGAKFAIFPCDEEVFTFFRQQKISRPIKPTFPDPDAKYIAHYTLNMTDIVPHIATPHNPCNSVPITDITSRKIKIDQVFIGSCTNGRLEDFQMAAKILKDRQVHPKVRLIATPASQMVWQQCLEKKIWEIFADANAVVTHATCGACAGIHCGVLGDYETCISTSNRNYQGRMGSSKSYVYLANAATAAASAVTGYITDPRIFL